MCCHLFGTDRGSFLFLFFFLMVLVKQNNKCLGCGNSGKFCIQNFVWTDSLSAILVNLDYSIHMASLGLKTHVLDESVQFHRLLTTLWNFVLKTTWGCTYKTNFYHFWDKNPSTLIWKSPPWIFYWFFYDFLPLVWVKDLSRRAWTTAFQTCKEQRPDN